MIQVILDGFKVEAAFNNFVSVEIVLLLLLLLFFFFTLSVCGFAFFVILIIAIMSYVIFIE